MSGLEFFLASVGCFFMLGTVFLIAVYFQMDGSVKGEKFDKENGKGDDVGRR